MSAPTEDPVAPSTPPPAAGTSPAAPSAAGGAEEPKVFVKDEFAAARERVGDPDDWRLEARAAATPRIDLPKPETLTPEEEAKAKRLRTWAHVAAVAASVLTVAALALHFLGLEPRGLPIWVMALSGAAALALAHLFPLARFPVRPFEGDPADYPRVKHVRDLTLRGFGVAFGILFVILAFMEVVSLLVGLKWIPDLSQGAKTVARNYVVLQALAVALVVSGFYVRLRMPSQVPPFPRERLIGRVSYGIYAFFAVLAAIAAVGLGAIVRYTEVEARQGIYFLGASIAALLVVANFRLGIPDAIRIIKEEVARSEEADRNTAVEMHRRMMRNYLFALVFVIGSVGFLVARAAKLIQPGSGGGFDVVLLVYLGIGAVFLAVVVTNYLQSKALHGRIVIGKKGQKCPGRRRYTPQEITRFTIIGVSAFFFLVFLVMTLLVATSRVDNLFGIDVRPEHGTDLGVFAIMSAIGPYGFYFSREARRIRAIDEKFPEFLRDLAESQRSGMTLPRALVTASRGVYGPLTKEIQVMSSQVEWGVSFDEALKRFAERTRTPLIQRTCSLIREAAASGGNVVDVLSAASDDAREIRNILTERKQQMGVYSLIVYIAFGVFLTVIGVLNSQFIPELAGATSKVAGTSLGGIQFGNINVDTYQRLFFHAALVQGIGGGLVSGVMTEGHPLSGLRHSFIMTLLAYGAFRFLIL